MNTSKYTFTGPMNNLILKGKVRERGVERNLNFSRIYFLGGNHTVIPNYSLGYLKIYKATKPNAAARPSPYKANSLGASNIWNLAIPINWNIQNTLFHMRYKQIIYRYNRYIQMYNYPPLFLISALTINKQTFKFQIQYNK